MTTLSVIILSYAIDDDIYKMNCKCIASLFDSEEWQDNQLQVVLIESSQHNAYTYDTRVEVLVPDEKFNFNRFLNIGITHTKSDLVALCNNDILFSKGWFAEIWKIKLVHPEFMCFSPIDRDYKTMSYQLFPATNPFYIGWDNKLHFAAWCFILDRKVFKTIGKLDEQFDFYFADDDLLMTLRKYALANVLVTHSRVKHLSQQVTAKVNEISPYAIMETAKYPIPDKYLKRGFSWLWNDIRFYNAFFRMENKWGDEKTCRRVNRLFAALPILYKPVVSKIAYSKSMNKILSIILPS